jgi:hypothetical protein
VAFKPVIIGLQARLNLNLDRHSKMSFAIPFEAFISKHFLFDHGAVERPQGNSGCVK